MVALAGSILFAVVLAGDRSTLAAALRRRSTAVLLAACAAVLGADRWAQPERGLRAVYRTEQSPPEGERSIDYRDLAGHTRVDRELRFDEEQRSPFAHRWPLGFLNHRRYATQWDRAWPTVHLDYPDAVERFQPSPRFRPEFDVTWSGFLVPDRSGSHVLRAEGGLRSRLKLDGAQAVRGPDASATVELEAGVPVELSVRSFQGPAEPTRFALLWSRPGGALEPVPPTSIFPTRSAAAQAGRARALAPLTALAGFAVGLAAAIAVGIAWAGRPRSGIGRGFLAVAGLALALRLAVHGVYFALPHSGILQGFLNDDYLHLTFAQRILLDDPWAPRHAYYWAPLYRYFLAASQLTLGEGLRSVVLVQNLLGALTCGLAYRIGHRLHAPRVGWCAGLLCAFCPFLAYYEWTTYIAAFATLAATVAIDRAVALQARWHAGAPIGTALVAAGATAGVAILARPNLGLFLLAVLAWVALRPGAPLARLGRVAAVGLAASLVIAPFSLRNWIAGGEAVALTSNGAVNVYVGNNPEADGTYRNPPSTVDPEQFLPIARDFILNDTGAWLALTGRKLELIAAERQLLPLLALGLAGWVVARRRREPRTYAVSAMAAGVLAVPVLFFVHDRFLLPAVPALAVLGGFALDAVAGRLERRGDGEPLGRPLVAAVILAAGLAFVSVTAYGTALRNRVQAPWNLGRAAPLAPLVIGDHR